MICVIAIFVASSIFFAYCKISRAINETGSAVPAGIDDLDALSALLKPSKFIPETTPAIPPSSYNHKVVTFGWNAK